VAFIQLIELRTSKFDEIRTLDKQWEQATEGKRTLRRSILCKDRNDPNRYVVLAFFDSYDSAMQNSKLPETAEFADRQRALADSVEFADLDVVEERG
jgi:hypothetical protein